MSARRAPHPRRSTRSRPATTSGSRTAAAVLHEIMAGNASEIQIAGFLIALRTKGETVEELAGLARTMRALAAPRRGRARRPARHGRDRRRAPDVQRLDDRGADRRRRGLHGRQARQPLGDGPVGLGRRARGARRADRPRPRCGGALHRRGRVRVHVRARAPPGDPLRDPGPPRARGPHDLQLPRAADQPGGRDAAADRRLRPGVPRDDGRRARAARDRARAARVERRRARRAQHLGADARRRGDRRRAAPLRP